MADPTDSTHIIPDENPHADEDPAYLTETDTASSNQSLTSSVLNYQYENGRRYHAFRQGEYFMPNDDREQERMDLHHHICRLMAGGDLFRAPIDPRSARILDLGTGTGIWAIEMADDYPDAIVKGTDLSPIQPGWVPPNCHFEVDDFESDWEFAHKFDFIHARELSGSVRDFPALIRRSMSNLNPGGWIELIDFDCELFADDDTLINKAPNLLKWTTLLREAGANFGKPLDSAKYHKQWLTEAGFKNVREEVFKVPSNPWAKHPKMKELGRFQQVNFIEGVEAFSLALFTRVLEWSALEVQIFMAAVKKELTDRSIHAYAKFYFVYGQKPETQ